MPCADEPTASGGNLYGYNTDGAANPPKKKRAPRAADVPIPKQFDTPAFRSEWGNYLTYRTVTLRKPWRYETALANLNKWARDGWSVAKACAAMEHSRMNQYQGVFPPKDFVEPKFARRPGEHSDQADRRQRETVQRMEAEQREREARQQEDAERFATLAALDATRRAAIKAHVVENCAYGFTRTRLAAADPLKDRMLATLMVAAMKGAQS
jgi:hypothetical protein